MKQLKIKANAGGRLLALRVAGRMHQRVRILVQRRRRGSRSGFAAVSADCVLGPKCLVCTAEQWREAEQKRSVLVGPPASSNSNGNGIAERATCCNDEPEARIERRPRRSPTAANPVSRQKLSLAVCRAGRTRDREGTDATQFVNQHHVERTPAPRNPATCSTKSFLTGGWVAGTRRVPCRYNRSAYRAS
jgi:hypothetical protein